MAFAVEGLGPGGLVQKGHHDQEHDGQGGEGDELVGRHDFVVEIT